MLAIGAAARDLAVHLASYSPPDKLFSTVRKAGKKDREMLAALQKPIFRLNGPKRLKLEWSRRNRRST
ncbi:hypothetical protein [Bacillus infantis]